MTNQKIFAITKPYLANKLVILLVIRKFMVDENESRQYNKIQDKPLIRVKNKR